METSQSATLAQPGDYHTLEMTTSYLLTQIASDVYGKAPTAKVKVPPHSTWTDALSVASKSLEEVNHDMLIFPQPTKERRDAVKKLALSEKSRTLLNIPLRSSTYIGHDPNLPLENSVPL
jgi:hypothetical protein